MHGSHHEDRIAVEEEDGNDNILADSDLVANLFISKERAGRESLKECSLI